MTELPRHSVSVVGIVLDEQRQVLAIRRRDNGQWQPPGGILELGETITDGLRREVLEETTVHVEPERLTGVYKNMPRGVIALTFRCRLVSGTPAPTDEATEVRWLTLDQVATLMTPAFTVRVTDALVAGHPSVRVHDGTDLLA